jgi:hypothetical protein
MISAVSKGMALKSTVSSFSALRIRSAAGLDSGFRFGSLADVADFIRNFLHVVRICCNKFIPTIAAIADKLR